MFSKQILNKFISLFSVIVLLLVIIGLAGTQAVANQDQNQNKDIRMKVFVHYPKSDFDGDKSNGKTGPVCQLTTNDQINNYGLTGWQIPAGSIQYHVNYRTMPANLTSANTTIALGESFGTWDEQENVLTFVEGASSPIARYGLDGVNLVAWGTVPNNAIAVTYTWYYANTGQRVESDTIMNKRLSWSWSPYTTDCAGITGKYDVQNIMTHEIGHWLGLNDLYDQASKDLTMYGYGVTRELKKDTLGLGDILGVEALYP